MADPGALHSCGPCVAIDHRSRLPAGNQHQLVFVATFGQQAGGESVPELMRMYRRQPSSPGPIVDHLVDARGVIGPLQPTQRSGRWASRCASRTRR